MTARSEAAAEAGRAAVAEAALCRLGIREARVHAHGDVARIELPMAELERLVDPVGREKALAAVRAAGFRFVSIDLEAPGGC